MPTKTFGYSKIGVAAWNVAPKYGVKYISCNNTMEDWECVFQGPTGIFNIFVKTEDVLADERSLTKILDTKISEQYPELAL